VAAFEAWLVFLILVVNVVGELQRKRTLAASRGFLAAARLSCHQLYLHLMWCTVHVSILLHSVYGLRVYICIYMYVIHTKCLFPWECEHRMFVWLNGYFTANVRVRMRVSHHAIPWPQARALLGYVAKMRNNLSAL